MRVNLAAFSLRYPAVVIALAIVAVIWGIITFFTIPRSEDPPFTTRICTVTTAWPGQAALKVEQLITDPLETAIDGLEEVDKVRSTTTAGMSTVYVEVDPHLGGVAVENAWDKVRARVSRMEAGLPAGTLAPVVDTDFVDTAAMALAIYQDVDTEAAGVRTYSPRQLELFAERIQDELELVEGVADTQLAGTREEVIYLEIDAGTWSQIALSTERLRALLAQRNIVTPGGIVETDQVRLPIRPAAEFSALQEIRQLVVDITQDGAPVTLKDLGVHVRRGYREPPSVLARYRSARMARPADCIVLSFTMKKGYVITRLGDEVTALLDRISATQLPPDVKIATLWNQPQIVERRIGGFVQTLLQAIAIVVLVAFLLIGMRIAMVMAAAIPVVIIAALGIVRFFGVQIEQISAISFVISLGLLVDNAIEVCDNTHRLMALGYGRRRAAAEGARQLAVPILMATLTTVFAFLPMLTIPGDPGEFLYSLPVVVSTTLIVSWVVAMTLTALMASRFLRHGGGGSPLGTVARWLSGRSGEHQGDDRERGNLFLRGYGRLCAGCLRLKYLTVLVAFLLFAGACCLVAFGAIGTQFFPDDKRTQFVVEVIAPEGASFERTNELAERVEDIVRVQGRVRRDGRLQDRLAQVVTYVGSSGPRFHVSIEPVPPVPNYALLMVTTTDRSETFAYAEDIRRAAAAELPGCRVIPRHIVLGVPVKSPVGLRIMGDDIAELRRLAANTKDLLRDSGLGWDVHDSWGTNSYELSLRPREDRARLAGISQADIANTTHALFSGHYLTTFREGDHEIPVYMRLPASERRGADAVRDVYVEGRQGKKIPLDAVADLSMQPVLSRIDHHKKVRCIEVRARPKQGYLANEVLAGIMPGLERIRAMMPPGYRLEIGGEQEETTRSQGDMAFSFQISLMLIVLCLVIQYNAFSKPLVILFTLPMAATGALLGLWITGYSLGFMAMLGLLSLAGVVLNSAIVYLEFAERLVAEKLRLGEGRAGPAERSCGGLQREAFRSCLVEAGKMRMLPIALTTLTTCGGLTPLALFGGPLWRPLAVVVIFGLLLATVLTLLVLPAVYAIFVERLGIRVISESPEFAKGEGDG